MPKIEVPENMDERSEVYRKGNKLRDTYTAAYAEATGTPYQRKLHAWGIVFLRAKELHDAG